MKKLDKITKITNIVLGIMYIPFSFYCWIMQMASEFTMNATNPTYIRLIYIFCIVDFLIPILCGIGIAFSVIFRKKGHSIWSFVIQFLPIIIFVLNMVLLSVAESLPRVVYFLSLAWHEASKVVKNC